MTPVYTDQTVVRLSSSDLTDLQFGTFHFEFLAFSGLVAAEYTTEGLFSVGLHATCLDL